MLVRAALLALCLLPGCSTTPAGDEWDRYQLKMGDKTTKTPELGKGLEGRMVEGRKVYTVQLNFEISTEGKVTHAEVHRSDAPERLQWAAIRTIKRLRFGPQKQPMRIRQTLTFNDLKVEPG